MADIARLRRDVVLLVQQDDVSPAAWRVTSIIFQEAASPTVAQSTSTVSKEAAVQTRLAAVEADEPLNSSGGGGNTWSGVRVRAVVDVSQLAPAAA